ncbi:DNA primase [Candidatus Gracilibacteria bacterium]|nr:MAG: DNA primase [Candidatus Gracilibacteria bacterium]
MGIVEELENNIDIVELVQKYTNLKKAGVNYKAICPFPGHNEKTPSFMVSPPKQIAYCFGCHKGGGALKFIMDIESCEFKEALEILGNMTGIKVNTNFKPENTEMKKSIYSLYKSAVNYYKNALKNYPDIKKYLFERGLNQETIDKFNFGYSDSGIELYNYLKNKGFDDKLIKTSNIFVDENLKKDKFINRIIFPIQNLRGDFVAFTARIIGKGEPKYLNSPASDIYDKSSILYGLYNGRTSITKKDYVIITEGQMDTIALHSAGFENTVAVSGTALTDKHLVILKRLTHKIFLCFDNDKAGQNATKLSLENLKNKGFEVKIIILEGGKDPDEIIKSGQDFSELIKKAVTPIGYYIKNSNFNINSIEEKKKLLAELLEIIKSYSEAIEKDFYLKEISKLLDINESIVYDYFRRIKFKSKNEKEEKVKNYSSEDFAIGYIIINKDYQNFFKENIIFLDYISHNLKKAIKDIKSFLEEIPLNQKEVYRGLSLEIEESEKLKTKENIENILKKLVKKINSDIYKKVVIKLKERMSSGDNEALKEYSKILKIAKKNGIK